MGIYVITGGATGIGEEVKRLLLGAKQEIFNIDHHRGGDIEADLSTDEARAWRPLSRLWRRNIRMGLTV